MTNAEHGTPEADLEELREAVLDDWLLVTSSVTDYLNDIQHTLSWRVTRPLRVVRVLQKRAGELGVVPTGQLAAVALAKKLRR